MNITPETMRNGRLITSRVGAMGLMQVMPATWAAMRDRYGLGNDPHDPRDNILAGTAYLRLMYDRFGYPGVFGAYNAGPERYADHLARGKPLPAETRAYVARLADRPATPAMPPATLSGERLFFTLGNAKPASQAPENEAHDPAPAGLFVPLTSGPAASVDGPVVGEGGEYPFSPAQYPRWIGPPQGRRRTRFFPAIGCRFSIAGPCPRRKKSRPASPLTRSLRDP